MADRKLFEADNNGPDVRLRAVAHEGNPVQYLTIEERAGGEWAAFGTVELHPNVEPLCYGAFTDDEPLVTWSWTHYHANGDRTRNDHRLTYELTDDAVEARHERRREKVLGFGNRDEYDWRAVEGWRVTADGITDLQEATA